jgi:ParB family chromosome partitioning protein
MTIKKRSGLGKGLSALLSDNDTIEKEQQENLLPQMATSAVFEIPVLEIETNPFQPRTHFDTEALAELSESIRVQGIIQPVTVRKLADRQYQLISGERRLQASKLAGLLTIPAYVRTANDQQMLEMALIENIQRENLNAIEIALSYQRLISECQLKQEELGDRVGKKRTTVNNYLRLLRLPADIQAGIRDEKISMGHARAIVNVEKPDVQLAIFNRIIEEQLSVRQVEELVRKLANNEPEQPTASKPGIESPYSSDIKAVQQKLSGFFGTKTAIKVRKDNQGEIRVPFSSMEDLNRLLDILNL